LQFCEICGYIKSYDNKFFSPLSFVAVFGSGIRDPGSGMGENQDPGSGINIPDPQHCVQATREAFGPKREHPRNSKNEIYEVCGSLLSSWIRIANPDQDPDPDPGTPLNPDPIRIRIRIHSTAFKYSYTICSVICAIYQI
jgi:hypothetical protein